ncbi:hypothetical protein CH300_26295 [Rhodococcus sp. 15-1154-1]|nr:hypothetical protein [Rhodococcus sp. 15-1154-1]OZE97692.1 hypothetical protein CH300_26295 [Rhodococcus sp. 15-1154-1]
MTTTITDTETDYNTLEMFPTTDANEYRIFDFTGVEHTAFTYLLETARENGLSLRHDPESTEKMQGWFVEDQDGKQVFAALITL